jgi:hypothetical protein
MSNIFVISSAINAVTRSKYSSQERFEQTLVTINSIDKYCQNNIKYLFELSAEEPSIEIQNELKKLNVNYIYMAADQRSKELSKLALNSLNEINCFYKGLKLLLSNNVKGKRLFKISGRYRLNENFIADMKDFDGKFVFAPALNSWMSKNQQTKFEVDKVLSTRLYHMDFNLVETYISRLPNMLNDCMNFGIDMEHSHYKHLKDLPIYEIDHIGVEGNIAPSGEFVKE